MQKICGLDAMANGIRESLTTNYPRNERYDIAILLICDHGNATLQFNVHLFLGRFHPCSFPVLSTIDAEGGQ